MHERSEHTKREHGGNNAQFKHYKVMVKILHGKKVEYQHLEIYTTGLSQLLEMRRIHNHIFAAWEEPCTGNNSCRKN